MVGEICGTEGGMGVVGGALSGYLTFWTFLSEMECAPEEES